MDILHCADIHLGVDNYSRLDPKTGFSTCFRDFLVSFDAVVDYAISTNVDLFLLAGDAYKSRDPSPTQQREFARRIQRLASAGIPMILLVGNHDQPGSTVRATSLDIFGVVDLPKVVVADKIGTHVICTAHGDIQVVTVPWYSRARMDSLRDPGLDGDPPDASIPDAFRCMLEAEIDKLNQNPDIPAIMVAHAHVSGALAGTELAMTISGDPIFEPSDLAYPDLAYVALGHIHKMQVIPCDIPMIYPGSIQRLDFGEEGEPKGFYVVDIEPEEVIDSDGLHIHKVSYEFVELPARKFLTIDITIPPGDENPTETALHAIAEKPTTGAIVRLRIDIDEADRGRLNESALYDALGDAQWVTVQKDIKRQHLIRVNGSVESATPLEMLGRYLDSKGTTRDYSDALMKQAAVLMKEVESNDSN